MTGELLLEADKPAAVLAAALELWRKKPHPRVTEVVLDAASRVPRNSIRGKTNAQTCARFLEVAANKDDADLSDLLDVFPCGKIADGEKQIAALLSWPSDPRLANHLLDLLDDPPYRSRKALGFWQTAFKIVERVRDRAAFERLTAIIDTVGERFAMPMQRLIRDALVELRSKSPSKLRLEPDEHIALNKVAAAMAAKEPDKREAGELLAAIHADPDDDELRLIYADACAAVGDPRGEFIVIGAQRAAGKRLSKEQRAREKAIIAEHSEEWLGDLARLLLKSSIKWRLGMLDAATIKAKHEAHVTPVIGDPRWSTLRALELNVPAGYHNESAAAAGGAVEELVLHPVMSHLRELGGDVSARLITRLADRDDPLMIERLLISNLSDGEWQQALVGANGLSKVRDLTYTHHGALGPDGYEWLTSSAFFRRLEHLTLSARARQIHDWANWFGGHHLASFTLVDPWRRGPVRWTATDAGTALEASNLDGYQFDSFALLLEKTDPGSVDSVSVKWRDPPVVQRLQALDSALERLGANSVKLSPRPD